MITRMLMKENLSFKEANLNFSRGLIVFTGLSGAGKSVLFKGILSAFGLVESEAKMIELELDDELNLEDYGILSESENVFKLLCEKNVKYFINNQVISKKSLANLSSSFVKYLSAKENNEFSNEKFLNLLDKIESDKNAKFSEFKLKFEADFKEFSELSNELKKILDEEKRVLELKELAINQIEKISSIAPKIGEYEELMSLKKKLSKKDKIEEAWARAEGIFEFERAVNEALSLCEIDTTFFNECLNELRQALENSRLDELEFDIESLLQRLEDLNFLIKRYESIENALEVLEAKKKELEHYENLSFEKNELEKKLELLKNELEKNANLLSKMREKNLGILENELNSYMKNLYMKNVSLSIESVEISAFGKDEIKLDINKTNLKNLSSGELNRLRLAFIATECKITNKGSGIIFLDEIDANLSGKEAMSIASVLNELANFYQIFAISHLPQLSSRAKNHFLVEKNGNQSRVRELKNEERIKELARMVSGEKISDEALKFAKTLIE